MVTDQLLETFKEVRANETTPAFYWWYVTDTIAQTVHDEVSPILRSDHSEGVEFNPRGFCFRTDAGAIRVVTDNERITERDYEGEVVAREQQGDAVLVRYS